MLAAGYRAVRYADDSVIVSRTRKEAEAALEQGHQILEGQLGLRLHPAKTRVVHNKVRHLTRRNQPRRADEIVALLNPVLRGWGRFFQIGDLRRIGRRLDRWILRRLRALMAKRWRTANWRRYSETFFYRRLRLHSLRMYS
jgi:hypothetical protein